MRNWVGVYEKVCGSSRSRGVAIILSKIFEFKVNSITGKKDKRGHI